MRFIESFGPQLKTIKFDAALENELPFMMPIEFDERKPSGDSRKDVYSVAAKSLDRAICIHFSYDRLDTVASSVP